jgi:hypothetical protein
VRAARVIAAGILGVAVLAATASAGERTRAAEGLLTEVEYSGTWKHTYTGPPSGLSANSGTETITSEITFTESVSLFTPPGDRGLDSADSRDNPVVLKLSGSEKVDYTQGGDSCSVSIAGRNGLKGNQWFIGGFGQPLAYISVNQSDTKGVVAAWAEAPGLRSSVHPEMIVQQTSGKADAQDCLPSNVPGGPVCNGITLINNPEYTPGDRGLDQPANTYGFLHAVAKLDPHTPTYTHPYNVSKVLTTCDGTDTIEAHSRLIVNNSRANGPPPSPITPQQKWDAAKLKIKQAAQDDLRWTLQFGKDTCGLLVAGLTFTAAGTLLLDPALAGAGTIVTTLASPTLPICHRLIDRTHNDLDTIHDPPLGMIHRLARVGPVRVSALPSCGRLRGKSLVVCQRIRTAAERLTVDVPRLAAIDKAVATTVGRGSAAVARRDNGAVVLQLGQLTTLSTQHGAALETEQADTVGLARALASAGIDAKVSEAQSAKGLASWLAALAHGVSVAAVRKLAGAALAPVSGSYVSILSGGQVPPPTAPAPPPTTPTITSVTFGGTATNPSFVVRGTNLGTKPQPNPAAHPSGQNGCPVVAGDDGYDYGTSLYIAVPARNWSGGRARPGETDCIDLVVTKFTPTEVDFHFGPFYAQNAVHFPLNEGDEVQVVINGATKTVHVKRGATATG